MKKQCSIEWLIKQFGIEEIVSDCKKEYRDEYIERINQAKQMHKQEIIESWENGYTHGASANDEPSIYHGTQYYKNTYENS